MPLNVEIRLNGKFIDIIHIGRRERLTGLDEEYTYVVTDKEYPQTLWEGKPRSYSPNFEGGIEFTHRYSDGARICVMKALQAIGPETDNL